MQKVYIVGGVRTPIGKTGGILKAFLPEDLTAHLLNKIIEEYRLNNTDIDDFFLGNCIGPGGNIARLSVLQANWPMQIPATTIDFQCGSGLQAINIAASQIQCGQQDIVVAGGVESTSLQPYKQYHPNDNRFQGKNVLFTRAQFSPLFIGDPEMVEGAENVAYNYAISREDMDKWALESHLRAIKTKNENRLSHIISHIPLSDGINYIDESIRERISLKLLQRAKPILKQDGRITPGNACLTHDGAALVLLASEKAIRKFGLVATAEWLGSVTVGLNPNLSPLGPIFSVRKLLEKKQLSIKDIDSIEINEAFAVQILTFLKEFKIDSEKINPFGGALAYGHPYGATGAIIMLHLLEALKKNQGRKGIATLGVAGGQGVATLIERCVT